MKIEKNKIVFYGIIGLIVIFIISYALLAFGDDQTQNTNLKQVYVPDVDVAKEQYKNKLDAINKEERINSGSVPSLYDDMLNKYDDQKEPELTDKNKQSIVDSIYNSGKIDYQKPVKKARVVQKRSTLTRQKTPDTKNDVLSEEEYRRSLIESRENMKNRDQDYSSGGVQAVSSKEFKAAFYSDQFVLPGDRCRLVLSEDVTYNGKKFRRGTNIYAQVSINKSRVLLNVTNINQVPVNVIAKDAQDGGVGVYNSRAGELWREYEDRVNSDVFDEAADELNNQINVPVVGGAVKALKSFFQKKRMKEGDKILLIKNHEVLLTPID